MQGNWSGIPELTGGHRLCVFLVLLNSSLLVAFRHEPLKCSCILATS